MTTPELTVKQLFDRESCTYTYLLIDSDTGEGAIIDGVLETFDRDMQIINELGIELLYAIETHAHADHITSAGKLREMTGVKLVYGESSGIEAIDIPLKDGESIALGHYRITAISTPGHTNGCTSFFCDGMLFSGDTLLIRGCGRTDFQFGDPGQLYDSITQKLFVLSDDTIVYPAHDYNGRTASSIGEEKTWNPRLGGKRSRESFIGLMNNLNLDMPKRINEAVPANLNVGINFDANRYLLRDFDMNDLHQIWQDLPENTLVMDNRTVEEFARGHVPGEPACAGFETVRPDLPVLPLGAARANHHYQSQFSGLEPRHLHQPQRHAGLGKIRLPRRNLSLSKSHPRSRVAHFLVV